MSRADGTHDRNEPRRRPPVQLPWTPGLLRAPPPWSAMPRLQGERAEIDENGRRNRAGCLARGRNSAPLARGSAPPPRGRIAGGQSVRPNPLGDLLAFLSSSGWTTVVFWLLLAGSAAVASLAWRGDPAQRSARHLGIWLLRLVLGSMWWQQSLWKIPPNYGGLIYWMKQMVTMPQYRCKAHSWAPWCCRTSSCSAPWSTPSRLPSGSRSCLAR